MKNVLTQVMQMKNPFILVIGDLMLDEIVSGDAERLSPDSPVPVLEVRSVQSQVGGAGNVAKCLSAMGARVECLGVVGQDNEGELLLQLLSDDGIGTSHIVTVNDRPTTVKRSIVGLAQHRHPQKMFRIDHESKEPIQSMYVDQLLSALNQHLPQLDAVCIEDYAKGVLSAKTCKRVIEHCREADVEVLVDPAGLDDYSKYSGATAITPNRSEAEKATGVRLQDDDPVAGAEALAKTLNESLNTHAIIITLDRHGAVLQEKGAPAVHVPTRARSVYDVTGAGDMVLSAIAFGRGGGLDWNACVEFANVSAGLEVEVFGAVPIPMSKIRKELLAIEEGSVEKIRSLTALKIEIDAAREAGKRIVLTNGCFDVIHAGHVSYLREAEKLGDVLIVGVNSDSQVREQKGEGRPIYSLDERMEILAELQCVSFVVSFEEPTAETLVREIQPDLYVKGGDYAPKDIHESALLEELGIDLRVLKERPGRSSTNTISQLKDSCT